MSFDFADRIHNHHNSNFNSFQLHPSSYFFETNEHQQQMPFQTAEDESYYYQQHHYNSAHSLPISHHNLPSSHISFSLHPSNLQNQEQSRQSYYLQQSSQIDADANNNYSSSAVFTNTVATHNYYQYFQQATQQQQQQQQQFIAPSKPQYEWNLQDMDAVSQTTQELAFSVNNNNNNNNCQSLNKPAAAFFEETRCRRETLETKHEDSTDGSLISSSEKSLENSQVLSAHKTIPQVNHSEPTSAVIIPASQKQQSQLKNANKFCMVSLLNFLTDVLPNNNEVKHLIKYIIRVKGSGKMRQKVDIFTLSHFRVLFLTLNDWNITQLTPADVKIHKIIFSELQGSKGNSSTPSWTKEDMDYMNYVKQQLLSLSLEFFEDSSNIKHKIQSKAWQNEFTGKHYIEWVARIAKGIKKMSSGVYIHRF